MNRGGGYKNKIQDICEFKKTFRIFILDANRNKWHFQNLAQQKFYNIYRFSLLIAHKKLTQLQIQYCNNIRIHIFTNFDNRNIKYRNVSKCMDSASFSNGIQNLKIQWSSPPKTVLNDDTHCNTCDASKEFLSSQITASNHNFRKILPNIRGRVENTQNTFCNYRNGFPREFISTSLDLRSI